MDKDKIYIELDKELNNKLQAALSINKEDLNDVFEKLIKSYLSDTFLQVGNSLKSEYTASVKTPYVETDNNAKARQRIPRWAFSPNQNNHKIIKAYFQLLDEKGIVLIDELIKRCGDKDVYPDTFVSDFRGNFAQMKTDAGNSHGKVFEVYSNIVEIWSEIADILLEYKKDFLESIKVDNIKITMDMSKKAYEIAKQVYSGRLTRTDGKVKIARESGMNEGSAQDFITIFLAMMEGQVYKRAFNNDTNRFLFESIRKDYGETYFRKALSAAKKHTQYYSTLGKGNLRGLEEIIEELS